MPHQIRETNASGPDSRRPPSRPVAVFPGVFAAFISTVFTFFGLGMCLAQPLEDIRPELVPIANLGALALIAAVGIFTYRVASRRTPPT